MNYMSHIFGYNNNFEKYFVGNICHTIGYLFFFGGQKVSQRNFSVQKEEIPSLHHKVTDICNFVEKGFFRWNFHLEESVGKQKT